MEQIRLVKEMRERDERNGRTGVDIRPRYMVWENVPGAFSSNKGEDFRIVLEELAKVCDQDAVIPLPDKGKWTSCGCIVGDGWSVAWRVLDAQFWGVPQRRRRIALVADFGGHSAPEILFVRKSLSGHTDESKPKRKATPTDASRGIGADDSIGVDLYNTAITGDVTSTLGVNCGMSHGRQGVLCYDIGEARLRTPSEYDDVSPTLSARCGTGGNNTPAVVHPTTAYTMQDREGCAGGGKGALIQEDRSAALRTVNSQYLFQPICFPAHGFGNYEEMNATGSLMCGQNQTVRGDTPLVVQPVCYKADDGAPVIALDRASYNQGKNAQYDFEVSDKGVNSPLVAKGPGAVCVAVDCRNGTEDSVNGALQSNSAHSLNGNNVVRTRYIVRRLTPLECERLQGYPDGWTDIGEWVDSNGKVHKTSDAARYKALGNSIALPPWKWVLKRICACYERDATMASLFDGIGGFPYLWEQINGKGSCLWASEIEEFPIAVTKVRIGE